MITPGTHVLSASVAFYQVPRHFVSFPANSSYFLPFPAAMLPRLHQPQNGSCLARHSPQNSRSLQSAIFNRRTRRGVNTYRSTRFGCITPATSRQVSKGGQKNFFSGHFRRQLKKYKYCGEKVQNGFIAKILQRTFYSGAFLTKP